MPTRKNSIPENTGRKRAFVARNRALLLKAAQEVLAEIGPGASIEQFALAAEVSVSTIYKHFESKEALIEAAFLGVFNDWQLWVDYFLRDIDDPLEELVIPIRLILRMKTTHPTIAQMASHNFAELSKYIPALAEGFSLHVKELVNKNILEIEDVDLRVRSIGAIAIAALGNQLLNEDTKEAELDKTVEIILSLLNITPAKAKKIASRPMAHLKHGL